MEVNVSKMHEKENLEGFMDEIPDNSFPFPVYVINLDRKVERYLYVREQLEKMGITKFIRVSGIDGFLVNPDKLVNIGVTHGLTERRGLAGCAASHIKIWKHIAENKMGWTLILEDDAHFHPDFMRLFSKYWKHVPKNAKIVFPGFCSAPETEYTNKIVIEKAVMCLQGYMISWRGAKYLLDNLLPIGLPVDIVIDNHFKEVGGSFIFNGNINIDGIRPNDYKEVNGRKCMFNGIIYQNHEEQGSTIHRMETVY